MLLRYSGQVPPLPSPYKGYTAGTA